MKSQEFFVFRGSNNYCNISSNIPANITPVVGRDRLIANDTQLTFSFLINYNFTDCFDFGLLDCTSNSTLFLYYPSSTNVPLEMTLKQKTTIQNCATNPLDFYDSNPVSGSYRMDLVVEPGWVSKNFT